MIKTFKESKTKCIYDRSMIHKASFKKKYSSVCFILHIYIYIYGNGIEMGRFQKFTKGLFSTKTLLYEGSLLHRLKYLFFFFWLHCIPYPCSVTFFPLFIFINLQNIFLIVSITPNP